MGFLKTFGKPLSFEESKKVMKIVRDDGISKTKLWDISSTEITNSHKFGFEFEFHKIYFDDKEKKIKIDLTGELDLIAHESVESDFTYQVEYGKWMIESKLIKQNFINNLFS